jgi:molecular chaperone HscB
MRSPILRRNQQIFKIYEAATQHNFGTSSARRLSNFLPICHSCSRKFPKSSDYNCFQRRWQTFASTSQTGTNIPGKTDPIPQTHYEFFPKTLPRGPPPSGPFHIDTRELRKEFLQLQAVAHPDRHPAHLKSRAEGTSARINEAYKTLQNPLLRTQYLLSLR